MVYNFLLLEQPAYQAIWESIVLLKYNFIKITKDIHKIVMVAFIGIPNLVTLYGIYYHPSYR